MELTLAEELLLASRTPQGKSLAAPITVAPGLAGALLLDLALHRHIALHGNGIATTGDNPPSGTEVGPEAEALWARIHAERSRGPKTWVRKAESGRMKNRVLAALAERGILRAEPRRVLGLFPSTRWAEQDPGPAAAIRDRLRQAMQGVRADDRTVALLLLTDTCGLSRRLHPDMDAKARKARIAKLSQGLWDDEDTGNIVRAVTKAVAASISAARASAVAASG